MTYNDLTLKGYLDGYNTEKIISVMNHLDGSH